MIDASHHDFDENVKITKQVVEYAHAHGVVVEGELGQLAGIEDDVNVSDEDASFTKPEQVYDFATRTGVDSLAIAIGTSHGAYKFKGEPKLDFERLKTIHKLIPDTPLVLHGASTVLKESVDKCNEYGGNIPGAQGGPEDMIKEFKKKGISLDDTYQSDEDGNRSTPQFHENEFVILKPDQSSKKTLLGRVSGGRVVPLVYKKSKPYGVSPRNVGQYFMQEALMTSAEEAPLVILKGMAGTAKTFYSLAVGMEKVYNNPTGEYRRVIVCRPNAQFDDDIGFLPGDEKEKIAPLMRPVIDNLEQILDSDEKRRYEDEEELGDKITEIFERGIIQTEAMNFIRGRSIARTYLIIDEAQNMTPNQVKGIITRAGQGTKIILLGDPQQIDKPFLDERTNGLSYAAKHMIDSSLCWQITLSAEECERSALAMDAIKRL